MQRFEKIQEMENEYINSQCPYLIEKILLDELYKENEHVGIVKDLYKEYELLKDKLQLKYELMLSQCEEINEMNTYFIEM